MSLTTCVKKVRQEWCRVDGYSESDGVAHPALVAVKSNCGWLILCDVLQDMNTGAVKRVPVRPNEIIEI